MIIKFFPWQLPDREHTRSPNPDLVSTSIMINIYRFIFFFIDGKPTIWINSTNIQSDIIWCRFRGKLRKVISWSFNPLRGFWWIFKGKDYNEEIREMITLNTHLDCIFSKPEFLTAISWGLGVFLSFVISIHCSSSAISTMTSHISMEPRWDQQILKKT